MKHFENYECSVYAFKQKTLKIYIYELVRRKILVYSAAPQCIYDFMMPGSLDKRVLRTKHPKSQDPFFFFFVCNSLLIEKNII